MCIYNKVHLKCNVQPLKRYLNYIYLPATIIVIMTLLFTSYVHTASLKVSFLLSTYGMDFELILIRHININSRNHCTCIQIHFVHYITRFLVSILVYIYIFCLLYKTQGYGYYSIDSKKKKSFRIFVKFIWQRNKLYLPYITSIIYMLLHIKSENHAKITRTTLNISKQKHKDVLTPMRKNQKKKCTQI